jgi:hypothetical protein
MAIEFISSIMFFDDVSMARKLNSKKPITIQDCQNEIK